MARTEEFKAVRVDLEIYRRVEARRKKDLRRDPMTNYIEYVLDLWGHNQTADMREVLELRKQVEALQVLLEAKQREAAELRVSSTAVEPIHDSGHQRRKAV